jgi:hypothetical protein
MSTQIGESNFYNFVADEFSKLEGFIKTGRDLHAWAMEANLTEDDGNNLMGGVFHLIHSVATELYELEIVPDEGAEP